MTQILNILAALSPAAQWDSNNIHLETKYFKDLSSLPENSAIIKLYNLKGRFLGLGIFSPESKRLSLLSTDESLSLNDILLRCLKMALKEAENRGDCLRLIDDYHGSLPQVIIEKYHDVYLLRTLSSGADLLIPYIVKIFEDHFQPSAIVLKNHCQIRLKRNLILNDGIVSGMLNSDLLQIKENDTVYTYNVSTETKLFNLHLVNFRKFFRDNNHYKEVLTIDINQSDLYPSDAALNCQFISSEKLNLIEITDHLRRSENLFDAVALKTPTLPFTEKNKTALFHFYHAALSSVKIQGTILIDAQNWQSTKDLIQFVAKKSKKEIRIIKSEAYPQGFHSKNRLVILEV